MTVLAEDEVALHELCDGCLDVSKQLQEALDKLEVSGKSQKWKSFRKALKAVWGKEKVDELGSRLDSYSQQLDRRVLVALRTRVDMLSLEQSEEFTKLDMTTQLIIKAIAGFKENATTELQSLQKNDIAILGAVQCSTQVNGGEHATTRSILLEELQKKDDHYTDEHIQTRSEASQARIEIIDSVDSAAEANRAEHEATRAEMDRLRKEGEEQVKQLREEIRLLKAELEKSVKGVVACVGKVSEREQQKLKETSNAKFNLWVAKGIVLQKLLDFLVLFKFNFPEDWNFTKELQHWKIHPYQKSGTTGSTRPLLATQNGPEIVNIGPTPKSYYDMSLHYPIMAGNFAMINFLIDNGLHVNASYYSEFTCVRGRSVEESTPLITTIRHKSDQRIDMIKLLLRHGADPTRLHTPHGAYESPLVEALKSEDERIVKVIVESIGSRGYNLSGHGIGAYEANELYLVCEATLAQFTDYIRTLDPTLLLFKQTKYALLRSAVMERMHEKAAVLLHYGTYPFGGIPDLNVPELGSNTPLPLAISGQDLYMTSLLLCYSESKIFSEYSIQLLEMTSRELDTRLNLCHSLFLLVVKRVKLKTSLRWAVDTKNNRAAKALLSNWHWLYLHRGDSDCVALIAQAFDLALPYGPGTERSPFGGHWRMLIGSDSYEEILVKHR